MSNSDFGTVALLLFALVATAHLCGFLFTRLRQPRVVGEILAGVIFGPALLGRFAPTFSSAIAAHGMGDSADRNQIVLGFLYNLGLVLLMFACGSETKSLFSRHDRHEIGWLGTVGTGLPFVLTLLAAPLVPFDLLAGPVRQPLPLLLVVAIAMAVTSIPVISKILHDLDILHTRFARLVLGVAMMEDIALWAILAVAVALAKSASLPYRDIALHVAATVIYFALGLVVMPGVLRRAGGSKWNLLVRASPAGYLVTILLAYCGVAAVMDVNFAFAAFLGGYAVAADADRLDGAIKTTVEVSFAFFVPIYFAMVGYQLDLTRSFSLTMLVVVLTIACAVKLLSAGLGARLAGFNWNDSVNLSMALNARGGPGIVLASVAFDAGIINAVFFTTLVVVAVLTSQLAGAWLEYVLRSGQPLLSRHEVSSIVETRREAVRP